MMTAKGQICYGNQSAFYSMIRYSYLNALHHHSDVWKPDIYFIKHGTFKVIF